MDRGFIHRALSRILRPFWGETGAPSSDFEAAAKGYRSEFPSGDMSWCCFRPHIDGFVVNAWSALLPCEGVALTRAVALKRLARIADWLRWNANLFGPGDRVQLIVGFCESVKSSDRQIFKSWMPAAALPDLNGINFSAAGGGFREMEGWSAGVKWPEVQHSELEIRFSEQGFI